jgi:tetratricopeptide (TPR) repeat protein
LLDIVTRIGARLRGRLGITGLSPAEAATVEASIPSNPAAVRLYAEGLDKLRLFDAQAARALLDQAVASDPTHPLAHSALALAWSSLGYDERARQSARRAYELSGSLAREDRMWVEGRYHEAMNEHGEAIKTYQALYGFFPDNLEYGLQLATAETAAGKGKEALETIDSLRRLPMPMKNDLRIDRAEAVAASALSDFKRQQAAAARAVAKGREQGARLLVASALLSEGNAWQELGETPRPSRQQKRPDGFTRRLETAAARAARSARRASPSGRKAIWLAHDRCTNAASWLRARSATAATPQGS